MMMFFITMVKRIGTNKKSKGYHPYLKGKVFNNIYPK